MLQAPTTCIYVVQIGAKGAEGCVELKDGKNVWIVDLQEGDKFLFVPRICRKDGRRERGTAERGD